MSDNSSSSPRFFILGKGFSRFTLFPDSDLGEFHVRSASEKSWVLAGVQSVADVEAQIVSGALVEFSPASLLGGVSSPAKSAASRSNGSKGGRPRKSV